MTARLLWCDDYDHEVVRGRLASIRAGREDWEWIGIRDDGDDPDNAWQEASRELGISPSFGPPGKIILCHGEPSFSKQLAKEIVAWAKDKGRCPVAPDVAFLLTSSPSTILAKAITAAAKVYPEMVKLGHTDRITKANAREWVDQRARNMGVMLSPGAAMLLFRMIGANPNLLTMEIRKLKALSEGGDVAEWAVKQYCVGKDGYEMFAVENAVLAGDQGAAFNAGIKYGSDPFRMMGMLGSSVRRYCVAAHGDGAPDAGLVECMVSKDGPMYTVDKLRTARSMVARAGRDESWTLRCMRRQKDVQLNLRLGSRAFQCPLLRDGAQLGIRLSKDHSRTIAELAWRMAETEE